MDSAKIVVDGRSKQKGFVKGNSIQAVKCFGKVDRQGRLVLPHLNLKKNTAMEVIVLVGDDDEGTLNLMAASESSLGFWDNPTDDAVWNHV